jgi:tetratricopeptide (TPR) repeat protein
MAKSSSRRRARAETAHLVARAAPLLRAGEYERALDPLLEALRLDPTSAPVHNDLGLAYMFTHRLPEAIRSLRRSITLRPNVGSTHHNLGLALQNAGDDEGAILAYKAAAHLSPERALTHSRLGDLLWDSGGRSEAAVAYDRASAAAPETPMARLCRTWSLLARERHLEAETEIRELIASEPTNAKAHLVLGKILQETGRFDNAAVSFGQSIACDPWEASAYYGVACSKRFTETERPWVGGVLSQLESDGWKQLFAPAMAERRRGLLHFAAGKVLDDLGEYERAMEHFKAANEPRRRRWPFDLKGVERRVNAIVARFTRECVATHTDLGDDDPTPILIVGMPRSGTTLVERIISSHPLVRARGELDFWTEHGPAWLNASPTQLEALAKRLRGDYRHVLRQGAPECVWATDKMPFNFFWVGLVHLLFPNARIIHCRRNPVDTCLSIYERPVGSRWGFGSGLDTLASYYRLYVRLMSHWRAFMPPNRFMELSYEELVAEPEMSVRTLLEFCSIDWNESCLHPEENDAAVKTASIWQARQPIYRSSVECVGLG